MTGETTTPQVGTSMLELEEVAHKSYLLNSSVRIRLDEKVITLAFETQGTNVWIRAPELTSWSEESSYEQSLRELGPDFLQTEAVKFWGREKPLSQALADLAAPFAPAQVLLDSLTIKVNRSSVTGEKLRKIILSAWCEAVADAPPSPTDLAKLKQDSKSASAQARQEKEKQQAHLLSLLTGGLSGVSAWNERSDRLSFKFRGVDLSHQDLAGAKLSDLDLRGVNLAYANLTNARFQSSNLDQVCLANANAAGADFSYVKLTGADLSGANLQGAQFLGARAVRTKFANTDLSQTYLYGADIKGADFSGAQHLHEADLKHAMFDEQTVFPPYYTPGSEVRWSGKSRHPSDAIKVKKLTDPSIDLPEFIAHLKDGMEEARLKNALRMLKAERFELFADVANEGLYGVVKSQTDGELVYCCRLTSGGEFFCFTQHLNNCGGLRGAVCKHILVLIIGLVRASRVKPTDVCDWIIESSRKKQELDREAASEVLLKYKGAQAGNVDWRPTETVPEDYYAF